MSNLKDAIEQFRNSQALVYKEQPKRIARDAQAARKTISDHTGRWLFEVIQNAEDAQANTLEIHVTSEAVYIADNSKIGFSPEAVESISGTDYSDKTAGTIGRKGVGFKAVYEISANPQIFTDNDNGVEFSQEKVEQWFDENGLSYETRIPYEWIPFFVSRQEAEEQDPVLRELHDYSTVIKLLFRTERAKDSAIKHLESWPPYAILPFKYLRTLQVSSDGLNFKVAIPTGREGDTWILEDSRNGNASAKWKVYHRFFKPPQELLHQLDPSDAERVKRVGFLVATPIDPDGLPVNIQDSPKIHVFYPTNELSPVGMVLHGEFLVKSDRTALLSIEDTPFNSWVAEKLAECVIEFVQSTYDAEHPNIFVRLLCPVSQDVLDSNASANAIWLKITTTAKKYLRLPDHTGEAKLDIEHAYLFEDNVVNPSAARAILAGAGKESQLLHKSFDNDEYARDALKRLGCMILDNDDILEIISEHAESKISDREWLWSCWQWLAKWLEATPSYREEYKHILKKIKTLLIIPCSDQTFSATALENRVLTWRSDDLPEDIPEWMPLDFVDDWLRDKFLEEDEKSPTREMAKELGISPPGQRVVMDAFEKAIDLFWKNNSVNPEKLLRFVFESDWPDKYKFDPQLRIQRCPVPVHISGNTKQWEHAC
ncbi:MAG: ATP-binding protein, partial [Planctomycetes bacterium]|nr:ATP-binding protein [Planctomycetota bacterium]